MTHCCDKPRGGHVIELPVRAWRIWWRGWADGARCPCEGESTEYGRTGQEAAERLRARYPAITEVKEVRAL